MIQQSALETKYVKIGPVKATVNGTSATVTTDGVQMAFLSPGVTPTASDWKAASWETVGSNVYARCLVGPNGGTVALAASTYQIWLKVVDNPEIIQETVDTMTVY